MPAIMLLPQVAEIIEKIEAYSYEANVAGRCVYDMINGEKPQDYDIITNADFKRLRQIFDDGSVKYSSDIDEKRGEITVRVKGAVVIISPYRKGFDENGNVIFAKNITEDLERREFSFLAIAFHPELGYTDPFCGGMCVHTAPLDIETGKPIDNADLYTEICAIGEEGLGKTDEERKTEEIPAHAFETNPISILTALAFASQGGFKISELTQRAIIEYTPLLAEKVSAGLSNTEKSSVFNAFQEILIGRKVTPVISECRDVISAIFPEFDAILNFKTRDRIYTVDLMTHTAASIGSVPPDKILRWALFFHELGKPDCFAINGRPPEDITYYGSGERTKIYASRIFSRFNMEKEFSRYELSEIYELTAFFDNGGAHKFSKLKPLKSTTSGNNRVTKMAFRASVKRLMKHFSPDELRRRLKLCYAIEKTRINDNETSSDNTYLYKRAADELDDIVYSGECYSEDKLAVKPRDIILRLPNASENQIALIIDKLLDMVFETPALNMRGKLLEIAEKIFKSS